MNTNTGDEKRNRKQKLDASTYNVAQSSSSSNKKSNRFDSSKTFNRTAMKRSLNGSLKTASSCSSSIVTTSADANHGNLHKTKEKEQTQQNNETHDIEESNDDGGEPQNEATKTKQVIKMPTMNLPSWMKKYFLYIGHVVGAKKQNTIKMKCILCTDDASECGTPKGTITAAPYFNFHRHLEMCHPDEFQREVRNGNVKITASGKGKTVSNSPFVFTSKWRKPTNVRAYSRKHPSQVRFMRDLMDCVAIDQLPLDVIVKPMFIKLIRNLDSEVRLCSRSTLTRRFKKFYYNEFLPKIRKAVNGLPAETLHIVLDLWSDRRHSSMIGFRAQYIDDDWKLHNTVLAFQHFPDRHSGTLIRKMFEKVLRQTIGVHPQQIGFVSGDNAANIKTAFKNTERDTEVEEEEDDLNEDDDDDAGDDVNWIDFDELMEDTDDDEATEEQNEPTEENEDERSMADELTDWAEKQFIKVPCYAHMIQLLIKDALKKNKASTVLVNDAKTVKAFFRQSPFWYDKFKESAIIGVVEQAPTRWNSVYYVFERLQQEIVRTALDKILTESRSTKNSCKVSFSTGDYTNMKIICGLLRPLQQVTDTLQADTVTSSSIIPAICDAYKRIAALDVDGNKDMLELQKALCEGITERFGTPEDESGRPLSSSRLKKIARDEIHKNVNVILATVLDPRMKSIPFKMTFPEPFGFNGKACTAADACNILREKVEQEKHKNDPPVVLSSQKPAHDDDASESTSFFGALDSADDSNGEEETQDEVSQYLGLPRVKEKNFNVLKFWKDHENKFPTLAKLARKYLGFPASSGSVERLFSIAGALQRSRRASLTWSTIQYLLCYRELRRQEIFD